ncbi:MAG: hypothetical protein AAGD00_02165 [Planctomycetota bacterium]
MTTRNKPRLTSHREVHPTRAVVGGAILFFVVMGLLAWRYGHGDAADIIKHAVHAWEDAR